LQSQQGRTAVMDKLRYQMAQERFKAVQTTWRRNHDALITKKLTSSGSESELNNHGDALTRRICSGSSSSKMDGTPKVQVQTASDENGAKVDESGKQDGHAKQTGFNSSNGNEDGGAGKMVHDRRASKRAAVGNLCDQRTLCELCGVALLDDALFCNMCGTKVQEGATRHQAPKTKESASGSIHAPSKEKGLWSRNSNTTGNHSSLRVEPAMERRVSELPQTQKGSDEGARKKNKDSNTPLEQGDSVSTTGRAALASKNRSGVSKKSDFDDIVSLSKQYCIHVGEVRQRLAEFHKLDLKHTGTLNQQQFEQAVRQRANLNDSEVIPDHLTLPKFRPTKSNTYKPDLSSSAPSSIDSNACDFGEYLLWCMNTAYAEEILVPDPNERLVRKLARKNKFVVTDVERTKSVFDRFDNGHTGIIEEEEFGQILRVLMNIDSAIEMPAKRIKRYWCEVPKQCGVSVSFEEFLIWYLRLFKA